MLYEVAIIKKPNKKEQDEGIGEKLLAGPLAVLADNDKVAAVKAMSKCKDVNETDLENVEVLVRPFVVRT